MCQIKRVTIPILTGKAILSDFTLAGKPGVWNIPVEDLREAHLYDVRDNNGNVMKRTVIEIDNNIHVASIPPDKVIELMELGKKDRVGFKKQ